MKGNNGSGNTVARDEWETPQWLFDILNAQYEFTFDCCANDSNAKCEYFTSDFLKANLGVESNPDGVFWMNPPFSKAKLMIKYFFSVVEHGVMIYRCDNIETLVWQEVIFPNADWVFIFDKRICYEGMKGKGSRFPSALAGVGVPVPTGLQGTLIKTNNGGGE